MDLSTVSYTVIPKSATFTQLTLHKPFNLVSEHGAVTRLALDALTEAYIVQQKATHEKRMQILYENHQISIVKLLLYD